MSKKRFVEENWKQKVFWDLNLKAISSQNFIAKRKMDQKINIWDKQQQNWIKEILSKSGTELKEINDKNGK